MQFSIFIAVFLFVIQLSGCGQNQKGTTKNSRTVGSRAGECTLEDGRIVPHGTFAGFSDCNRCTCYDALIMCTQRGCGVEAPKTLPSKEAPKPVSSENNEQNKQALRSSTPAWQPIRSP